MIACPIPRSICLATVIKKDLARIVAQSIGCTNEEASTMIDAAFVAIMSHLIDDHRIEVRGFGSLTVRHVSARPKARNPRTGESVSLPPRRRVQFRPGARIKSALSKPLKEASLPRQTVL